MLSMESVRHVTQTYRISQEYTMTADRANLLSVHRAFVIQLSVDADVDAGRVSGRVEHVVSGQALYFASLEALLAFIAAILRGQPPSIRETSVSPETARGSGDGERAEESNHADGNDIRHPSGH
jgi:hypothetical protein